MAVTSEPIIYLDLMIEATAGLEIGPVLDFVGGVLLAADEEEAGAHVLTADAGWQGSPVAYGSTPGTLANWTGTVALDANDLTYISTDDNNNVDEPNTGGPPPFNMGGILVRFDASEWSLERIQLDWSFRGHDDGSEAAELYVYNFNSAAFDAVSDSYSPTAPGDYTLTESLSANLSNYEDGSGYIYGLIVSNMNGIVSCKLEYATLTVTTGGASEFVPFPFPAGLRGGLSALTGGLQP